MATKPHWLCRTRSRLLDPFCFRRKWVMRSTIDRFIVDNKLRSTGQELVAKLREESMMKRIRLRFMREYRRWMDVPETIDQLIEATLKDGR